MGCHGSAARDPLSPRREPQHAWSDSQTPVCADSPGLQGLDAKHNVQGRCLFAPSKEKTGSSQSTIKAPDRQIVLQHCIAESQAAKDCLDKAWSCLENQGADLVKKSPALESAIRTRSVVGVIETLLALQRSGAQVELKVERLAIEVSAADERWLFRKSLQQAVAYANAADIEFWASQARGSQDELTLELAYAEALRATSAPTESPKSSENSSTESSNSSEKSGNGTPNTNNQSEELKSKFACTEDTSHTIRFRFPDKSRVHPSSSSTATVKDATLKSRQGTPLLAKPRTPPPLPPFKIPANWSQLRRSANNSPRCVARSPGSPDDKVSPDLPRGSHPNAFNYPGATSAAQRSETTTESTLPSTPSTPLTPSPPPAPPIPPPPPPPLFHVQTAPQNHHFANPAGTAAVPQQNPSFKHTKHTSTKFEQSNTAAINQSSAPEPPPPRPVRPPPPPEQQSQDQSSQSSKDFGGWWIWRRGQDKSATRGGAKNASGPCMNRCDQQATEDTPGPRVFCREEAAPHSMPKSGLNSPQKGKEPSAPNLFQKEIGSPSRHERSDNSTSGVWARMRRERPQSACQHGWYDQRKYSKNSTASSGGAATGGRTDESKPRSQRPKSAPPTSPLRAPRPKTRQAYLDLLGFERLAQPSKDELKRAYHSMAMRWHPDRPHNQGRAVEAAETFKAAKEAYDYLLEEHRRAACAA